MKNFMTIKEFSELTHTSVDTLKHYDRIGLFHPAKTGSNGYRYYLPEQSIYLTRILFGSKAGIPLKDIETYVKINDSEVVLKSYENIIARLTQSKRDWGAIENAIGNLRYYYSLTEKYKEGELFTMYLPEWFIIQSPLQTIAPAEEVSNSEDIVNDLFFNEYRTERWPHYLLGALYTPEEYRAGNFNSIRYFLKIDHPENYAKSQITFIEPGYWACMLFYTGGKGLGRSVRKYLETLHEKHITIHGNILAMDVINNLITSNPEEYCTMIYALKGNKDHD